MRKFTSNLASLLVLTVLVFRLYGVTLEVRVYEDGSGFGTVQGQPGSIAGCFIPAWGCGDGDEKGRITWQYLAG